VSRQLGGVGWIGRIGTVSLPAQATLGLSFVTWTLMDSPPPNNFHALTAFSGGGGFSFFSSETFIDNGQLGVNAAYLNLVGGSAAFERLWDGGDGTQYAPPNDCFDQSAAWTCLAGTIDNASLQMRLYSRQGNGVLRTDVTMPAQLTSADFVNYAIGSFTEYYDPAFTWPGKIGMRAVWTRVLTDEEMRRQLQQIAPVTRQDLWDFNPGLDQPPHIDFGPRADNFTYPNGTVADTPVSASNPPLPWTRSGMMM